MFTIEEIPERSTHYTREMSLAAKIISGTSENIRDETCVWFYFLGSWWYTCCAFLWGNALPVGSINRRLLVLRNRFFAIFTLNYFVIVIILPDLWFEIPFNRGTVLHVYKGQSRCSVWNSKSSFLLQIYSPKNRLLPHLDIDSLYLKSGIRFSFLYIKFLRHNLKILHHCQVCNCA